MGILLSPLTCRTFLDAHPTGHGFLGAPYSSKLQMIMAADTAHRQRFQETQEAKSTEMQQKKKRRKKKSKYHTGDSTKCCLSLHIS